MNSPAERIVILAGARVGGRALAGELVAMLASLGGEIVIVDEDALMSDSVREVLKIRNEHFFCADFPTIDVCAAPKSEFELRQEWLDGFRAKHQQRTRRSRK